MRWQEENSEAVPDDMEPQERYMVRYTEEHKRFSKFWSLYHGS